MTEIRGNIASALRHGLNEPPPCPASFPFLVDETLLVTGGDGLITWCEKVSADKYSRERLGLAAKPA